MVEVDDNYASVRVLQKTEDGNWRKWERPVVDNLEVEVGMREYKREGLRGENIV